MSDNIIKTEYSDVMQKSYIDYSMSVITARALPDIKDGLKPVQRRVLYAMDQLGLAYDKPHRKSARIVGDAMGKYHPHGDSSIYETLVVMSQDFKKGMALVEGHGNFGSIEGDGAAAMRYTEAKLKKFTSEVFLADLDKNVVDFTPNFDGTEQEPVNLPVRVPNILINGADGIAVGMATNIPPHNLSEVIDAAMLYMDSVYIKKKAIEVDTLLEHCKGPDFPTGGIIVNKSDLADIYRKGIGKIKIRGKVEFEKGKGREKDRLVITEIPYTMVGAGIGKFMTDVADLIENKKASDIVDISNESSKEGIRIVLYLKKDADVEYLKNLLYKKTKLEDTFGVNMLATVDGRPETLGILDILKHYSDFQLDINTRKYEHLLSKELDNKEIKEGLIMAVDCIDLIIEILRGSKDLKMAKGCLVNGVVDGIKFKSEDSKKDASVLMFTEKQADAVLSMRLYKLIGLELNQLKKDYDKCLANIKRYEKLLGSKSEMVKSIKKELEGIKKEFGYDRKTVLEDAEEAVIPEKEEEILNFYFTMDRLGYVKVIEESVFNKNKDIVTETSKRLLDVLSNDSIYIFTDKGMLHRISVSDIPLVKPKDKGVPIDNIGNYKTADEDIMYMVTGKELAERSEQFLLFTTESGLVKKVQKTEFNVLKRTTLATKLSEGDRVVSVIDLGINESEDNQGISNVIDYLSDNEEEQDDRLVTLKTKKNYKITFPVNEVPVKKKVALGVTAIKLSDNDTVKEVSVVNMDNRLKVVHRGGKGSK